jgi:hypothetical protein
MDAVAIAELESWTMTKEELVPGRNDMVNGLRCNNLEDHCLWLFKMVAQEVARQAGG